MPLSESLDVYFANDTVPVIYNGSPEFRGIVDDYEQVILDGPMETGSTARINAVTVKSLNVAGIQNEDEITVNGVVRMVIRQIQIHDGKLTHIQLGD